jgi:hypothetical protein
MVYSQLAGPRFDAGGCNLKGDTPLQTSPLRGLTPPLTTPYGDASLIIKMRHIINTRIIPVTYNANTVTVETVIRNHIRGLILTSIRFGGTRIVNGHKSNYYIATTIDRNKILETIEI